MSRSESPRCRSDPASCGTPDTSSRPTAPWSSTSLPGDPPLAVFEPSRRLHVGQIRPGVGLGVALTPVLLAPGDGREESLFGRMVPKWAMAGPMSSVPCTLSRRIGARLAAYTSPNASRSAIEAPLPAYSARNREAEPTASAELRLPSPSELDVIGADRTLPTSEACELSTRCASNHAGRFMLDRRLFETGPVAHLQSLPSRHLLAGQRSSAKASS